MPRTTEKRVAILGAVSDWLKLLALIVLASEALLVFAYSSTKEGDRGRPYFVPLMIGLFTVIVVGVFFDRWLSSRSGSQSRSSGDDRFLHLATRWYFKSGITEEELKIRINGNSVSGTRTTKHPKGKITEYHVTGWNFSNTYWLEYHLPTDNGGGALLLDEFTNERWSGIVTSKDCDTGVKQCRANMWFPVELRKNHKKEYFMFIAAVRPTPNEGFAVESTESFKSTTPVIAKPENGI
jgi:hypothetical protein